MRTGPMTETVPSIALRAGRSPPRRRPATAARAARSRAPIRTSTSRRPARRAGRRARDRGARASSISSLSWARSCKRSLGEQARRALDVERVLGGLGKLGERRGELPRGTALGRRQRRVGEPLGQHPRAEAEADEPLVEVAGRPVARPVSTAWSNVNTRLVTPPVEVIITTMSTCGWSTSTSTWRIGRGFDRRRGDDRQQVRDLRERLGSPHRLVDLAADERELQRARRGRPAPTGSRRSTK